MSERYRLKRLFAQGGMAEVYLGVSVGAEGFEKPVAIKRMLPHLAKDPRVAQMFLAEAKLAKFLSHQNVVQVLDVGKSDDGLYLVMELVDGWDLETLWELARDRGITFPPALAAFVGAQTQAGLLHAYRRSQDGKPLLTAHRDISGSNVLVSTEGEVKVTDFGIARVDGLAGNKTEPGTFKGKIAYAAPELLRGEPASHASDQFALGVVLFKLLAGAPPFFGAEVWSTYYQGMMAHTPALPPSVPAPLAKVVLRLLEKTPAARFETPEAVAKALSSFLSSCGEPASPNELAAFLETLHPPPPAAQQMGAGESLAPTFSLKSQTGAPPLGAELMLQSEWQPNGKSLDASGEVSSAQAPGAPHAQPVRCNRCGAPLPAAGARCARCEAAQAGASLELARAPRAPEEPLELAHSPRPDLDAPKPPERPPLQLGRAAGKLLKGALVLAVLGGVGAAAYLFAWPVLQEKVPSLRPRQAVLQIDSEPPGAAIVIDGSTIGTTPFFTENLYPKREIPFQLVVRGYRPWKGSFSGGREAKVHAVLDRK